MGIFDVFDSNPKPKHPEQCDAFSKYHDPLTNHQALMRAQDKLADATNPSKKAEAYSDMAERYLKVAVSFDSRFDVAATKTMLYGTDLGRNQLDKKGAVRGYDGVFDVINKARENGASADKLKPLEVCADALKGRIEKREKR